MLWECCPPSFVLFGLLLVLLGTVLGQEAEAQHTTARYCEGLSARPRRGGGGAHPLGGGATWRRPGPGMALTTLFFFFFFSSFFLWIWQSPLAVLHFSDINLNYIFARVIMVVFLSVMLGGGGEEREEGEGMQLFTSLFLEIPGRSNICFSVWFSAIWESEWTRCIF